MSCVTGDVGSLWEARASVPDHRRAVGKRYPLASLLLIAVAALLSGRRDQLGIVRWGRKLTADAAGEHRDRVVGGFPRRRGAGLRVAVRRPGPQEGAVRG
jgi:hypothetical protein